MSSALCCDGGDLSLIKGGKMSSSRQLTRRVAVMGFRAVGKSSLTIQFVEGQFVDSYLPTIENTFQTVTKYKGQEYLTEIVDTAGQDEFSIFPSVYSVGIHGYVLVYSVTSRTSFEMVKIIREKLLNLTGTNSVPMVLVGNKTDLHLERLISLEEGRALAEEWTCAFVEASAKHDQRVADIFQAIICEIEKTANPSQAGEKDGCCIL